MSIKEDKDPREDKMNDDIDISNIFSLLWKGKSFIVIATIIFGIISVIYSLSLPNYYRSETLLFVSQDSSNMNQLSQYSGLAAMAGINLPSNGDDKSMQAIELIKSRTFLKHLLSFEGILPSIMAIDFYNSSSREIKFDESIFNTEEKKWVREPTKNYGSEPTYLEVFSTHPELISISKDKLSGFITVSVEHQSPYFAKDLLDLIVTEANAILRERDLERSSKSIQYLKSELADATLAGVKQSINSLIELQFETQMMARVNKEYVLSTIDPSFVPERKSKPSRALICIIITLSGFFLSSFFYIVRNFRVSL